MKKRIQTKTIRGLSRAQIERRMQVGPNADFAGPHVLDHPAVVDTTEPEPANEGSQGSRPKPRRP